LQRNLYNVWPESSSVSNINLAKKILYNSRDIDFSQGLLFGALKRELPLQYAVYVSTTEHIHIDCSQ